MEVEISQHGKSARVRSIDIAKHFGKRHDHVMRDIERLIRDVNEQSPNLGSEYFAESNFINDMNREYREYLMDEKGFSLLAMGFTGKRALSWKLKYIAAFDYMADLLQRKSRSAMDALAEAVSALESDKEKVSHHGKALASWKKIKDQHIEAIIDANKKTQMLLDLK